MYGAFGSLILSSLDVILETGSLHQREVLFHATGSGLSTYGSLILRISVIRIAIGEFLLYSSPLRCSFVDGI